MALRLEISYRTTVNFYEGKRILTSTVPFDKYRAPIITYTRGHSQRFHQVAAQVNVYLCSFFPSTIKLWKSLPELAIQAGNVEEFKKLIQSYYS